ncbi:MAG TPA: PEP/pyruvate-binding domain-containing protein [Pirellulales bacterium]|nr:PEP/pyruvate-binding domain-containing protein [Pirellulales bacterium]
MNCIRFLTEIEPDDLESVGGKGLNLGIMYRAKLPVPDAFCVVSSAHRAAVAASAAGAPLALTIAQREQIAAAYRRLGSGRVAVRSSAVAEDGSEASFAGQQETYLGIVGEAELLEAVVRCWRSIDSERARAYRQQQNIADDAVAMSVVVQQLIEAEAAGVLFTSDPSDAQGKQMLVESSWGLGESVVSGRVTPDRFHLDRESGQILDRHISTKTTLQDAEGIQPVAAARQAAPSLTDQQLAELADLGRQVEAYYQGPRDVEWASAAGKMWLLQARPITVAGAREREAVRQEEIAALAAAADPKGTVWAKFNLSEILPSPTPLTWTIVRRFMAGKGGYGLMYRDLGFDADPALDDIGYFDLVCGRPYVNLSREPQWHFRDFPYGHDFAKLKDDPAQAMYPQPAVDPAKTSARFWLRLPVILFRILRANRRMNKLAAKCPDRLRKDVFPALAREVKLEAGTDYTQLSPLLLLERFEQWRGRVLNDFARESLRPAMFVSTSMAKIEAALTPALGAEQAAAELRDLLTGIHPDPEADLPAALQALGEGTLSREDFLRGFGHRGASEMELAVPRWSEAPDTLPVAGSIRPSGAAPLAAEQGAAARFQDLLTAAKVAAGQRAALEGEYEQLRTLLALRETAKHYLMLGYQVLRRLLVELGRQTKVNEGIFYLEEGELPRLVAGEDFAALIRQRRERRKLALSLEAPSVIFSDDLEAIGRPIQIEGATELTGTAISAGVAEGVALVLTEPVAPPGTADGFILVCPSTDPAWVPLFLRAKGLVMETGGMLSHGAIVAREFGLPGVAGIADVQARLRTGQNLRVDGNTGSVHVFE